MSTTTSVGQWLDRNKTMIIVAIAVITVVIVVAVGAYVSLSNQLSAAQERAVLAETVARRYIEREERADSKARSGFLFRFVRAWHYTGTLSDDPNAILEKEKLLKREPLPRR